MGAGKSTFGAALAARTGWPHLDNDVELERATGRPLAYWAPGDALHAAEDRLLKTLVSRPGPFIADVPAGTADRPDVLAALSGEEIIYVRAPLDVLVARCVGTERPLGEDPAATLSEQWQRRDAIYGATATLVLDGTLSPARQTDLVLDALGYVAEVSPHSPSESGLGMRRP
jgi:shikimate kinase